MRVFNACSGAAELVFEVDFMFFGLMMGLMGLMMMMVVGSMHDLWVQGEVIVW